MAQRATLSALAEGVAHDDLRGWTATERAQATIAASADAAEGCRGVSREARPELDRALIRCPSNISTLENAHG